MDRPVSALQELGSLLSGEFDNRPQALAEPAWYVHIRLWHRAVDLFSSDSLTFFIEQIGVASGKPPYRQRLLRLQETSGALVGRYYGLKVPAQFQGGATDPARLRSLTPADTLELPTCRVHIARQPSSPQPTFVARMAPGELGSFEYGGKTTYLSLGFDIGPLGPAQQLQFSMYDKGVNPETGKGTWGALLGPFQLLKQSSFAL